MTTKNIAVIVGAGLATRLAPISLSIPKVLVNYGNDTVLKHLYNIYKDSADRILVAVPDNMVDITTGYCEDNDLPIEVIGVDKPLGSLYAICAVQREVNLDGHNVIFNWSDIIPEFEDKKTLFKGNVVYTFGDECRFNFDGSEMVNVGSTGGNVVGVYQMEDCRYFEVFDGDLVEMELGWSTFDQINLKGVVDIGDFNKLRHHSSDLNMMAREFNEIRILDDIVEKIATSPRGVELQRKEVEWYLRSGISHFRSIRTPRIYHHNPSEWSVSMERINGTTLAEHMETLNTKDREEIIHKLVNIHAVSIGVKSMSPLNVLGDYYVEFVQKIMDRNKSVEGLIRSEQFSGIKSVNGQDLVNLGSVIASAFRFLTCEENLPTRYVPIHGDLNFSNILVEKATNGLVMIDPRGYFGNSVFYGPKDYDIAKILYACSGYDRFNRTPDWAGLIRIDDHHLDIMIEPLINWEASEHFEYKHQVMVAIIWMALAGYFKNNPYKACAAYFYGWYLLSKLSDEGIIS